MTEMLSENNDLYEIMRGLPLIISMVARAMAHPKLINVSAVAQSGEGCAIWFNLTRENPPDGRPRKVSWKEFGL
jgi:hypothetical protein